MASASRLRQRLRRLCEQIPELVEPAYGRSALWRGVVYEARRKCGKAGCRCTQGQLHVSWTLTDRSGKRARSFTLHGSQVKRFRRMTEDYRKLRRARARFVKVTNQILEIFDQLEQQRRDEAVRRYGGELEARRRGRSFR